MILIHLFCARVRRQLSPSEDVLSGELLTTEQVRRAANVMISTLPLPPKARRTALEAEAKRQEYYAWRNAQASKPGVVHVEVAEPRPSGSGIHYELGSEIHYE